MRNVNRYYQKVVFVSPALFVEKQFKFGQLHPRQNGSLCPKGDVKHPEKPQHPRAYNLSP